jgi:hypothetical protein
MGTPEATGKLPVPPVGLPPAATIPGPRRGVVVIRSSQ